MSGYLTPYERGHKDAETKTNHMDNPLRHNSFEADEWDEGFTQGHIDRGRKFITPKENK